MPYDIGTRVIVDLRGLVLLGSPDLRGRTEAIGTVVDRPGGVLYNVRLDEPLAPGLETLTFVSGRRLRPMES
jgi:hypothetical protein